MTDADKGYDTPVRADVDFSMGIDIERGVRSVFGAGAIVERRTCLDGVGDDLPDVGGVFVIDLREKPRHIRLLTLVDVQQAIHARRPARVAVREALAPIAETCRALRQTELRTLGGKLGFERDFARDVFGSAFRRHPALFPEGMSHGYDRLAALSNAFKMLESPATVYWR